MAVALESFENDADLFRLVLEPKGEGVYVFAFETEASAVPERDYLLDTLQDAVAFCAEEYGAPEISWNAVGGRS